MGALSTPGPAVLTRTGDNPQPAACRPSTARVLSPRHSRHPSGAASYEASVKGSRSSPARPSPHPWPPDDSGDPPAFPRAPHPRGRTRARTPGQGQAQSTSPEQRHQHYLTLALQSARFTRNMCDLVSHSSSGTCYPTPTPSSTTSAQTSTPAAPTPTAAGATTSASSKPSATPSSSNAPPDPPRQPHPAPLTLRRMLPRAQ
jgi:hypothetical protein